MADEEEKKEDEEINKKIEEKKEGEGGVDKKIEEKKEEDEIKTKIEEKKEGEGGVEKKIEEKKEEDEIKTKIEEKKENEEINNTDEEKKKEKIEIINCDFCRSSYTNKDIDIFSCNHKICSKCLFRKIFINNIKDIGANKENIEIKCKCNQGNLNKTIDNLYEINNKKNLIYEKLFKENKIVENNELCSLHKENKLTHYCIDCSEDKCDLCIKDEKEKEHKIYEKENLINILKKEISTIKMNYPNKESFELKWKELCNKLKENTQIKFNEMILKIEEVTNALINFKNLYEDVFKQELVKSVKILKLYKLFYFNYYFEKNSYKESNDINFLRYLYSLSNEISSIEITRSDKMFKELESIKTSINLLKFEDSSFTTKLSFKKIHKGYKVEQIIEKAHDKLLNGIFELNDKKILTGSLDFSMKIWQEKNHKYEKIKIIKGQCGAICSMTLLSNGNIITTAGNNNNINIWSQQNGEDNYIVSQSLSSHTKAVLTVAELQNGKLISGGLDELIIIWDKDANGSYIEKQRIKDKKPITKIIPLLNNKFAFTSDNRVRIMIQKEIKKSEVKEKESKELNDVFDDLDFDNNIENEEDPFIVCYKLSKHEGRVKSMVQLRNGYLVTGGSEMAGKKDSSIIIWKPNEFDGFFYVQTLNGHKSDINGLIELKDGRVLSSSKDRTLRIWKSYVKEEKNKENFIQYKIDEILNEYKHGIYLIVQISDGRIISSTSEGAIVVWKDNKYLTFC